MAYYYIVDSYQQLKANPIAKKSDWDAMGTVEQDFMAGSRDYAEMLVAMYFATPWQRNAWEAYPYVHPLPDPLDTDPVSDEHFAKLERFHGHQKDPVTGQWKHKDTGVVLAQVPHTRKLMNNYVSKVDPSFRFHIFH